jgi:thiamine-phosphate pyrophosphorylase
MQLPGLEPERRERLLGKIEEAARSGVDFVQLREKDLSTRELESLAGEAMMRIRESPGSGGKTRLLINSRADVALAVQADGVHLRSKDISPGDVRQIWSAANASADPVVAVSCHSDAEVVAAEKAGADFVVFGPTFAKSGVPEKLAGLELLGAVCRHGIPVLALGGVMAENARLCTQAGAKGVAGIRLFQEGNLGANMAKLRS